MAPVQPAKSYQPEDSFDVKEIIGIRRRGKVVQFHTVWEVDGSKTWEPLSMFDDGLENLAICQYKEKYPVEFDKVVNGKRGAWNNVLPSMPNKRQDTRSEEAPRLGSTSQMASNTAVQNWVIVQFNQAASSLGNPNQLPPPDVADLFNEDHPSIIQAQEQCRLLRDTGKIGLIQNESDCIQYLFVLKQVTTWFYNVYPEPFNQAAREILEAENSIRSDAVDSRICPMATFVYQNLLDLEDKRTTMPVGKCIDLKLVYEKINLYADTMMTCPLHATLFEYCEIFLQTINYHKSKGEPTAYVTFRDVAGALSAMVNALVYASGEGTENWERICEIDFSL